MALFFCIYFYYISRSVCVSVCCSCLFAQFSLASFSTKNLRLFTICLHLGRLSHTFSGPTLSEPLRLSVCLSDCLSRSTLNWALTLRCDGFLRRFVSFRFYTIVCLLSFVVSLVFFGPEAVSVISGSFESLLINLG